MAHIPLKTGDRFAQDEIKRETRVPGHAENCNCEGCVALWADSLASDEAGESVYKSLKPDAKSIRTLNDYQLFAGVTANMDLDPKMNLAVLSLGIAGEAGEVADYMKKHLGHDHVLDRTKLLKELGDVLWYIAVLANANDISLQEVAQANIDKLSARYPNGFNIEQSKNRKTGDV